MRSMGTYKSCEEATLGPFTAMFRDSRADLSAPKASSQIANTSCLFTEGSVGEVTGEAQLGGGMEGSGRDAAETGTSWSGLVRLRLDSALSRGECWTYSSAFHWLFPRLHPSSSSTPSLLFFFFFSFSPLQLFFCFWLRGTVPTCVYISLE